MDYKIKYFTLNSKTRNLKLLQILLERYKAEEIEWTDFELSLHFQSHNLALDNIEHIYNTKYKDSKLMQQMVSLLNSDMTHLVYKKDLLERLQKFYSVHLSLNSLAENANTRIIFIPSEYIQFKNLAEVELNSLICIPLWTHICTYMNDFLKKFIYIIALALFPFWIMLWKIRKIELNTTKPKEYQVGIRVYNNDWGFHNKYRTIDFILDQKKLNNTNTLFCIETNISNEYAKQLQDKNYKCIEINKILGTLDVNFIKNTLIKKIIPCSFNSSLYSLSKPSFLIETTIGILYKYMTWTHFLQKYKLKHYVVYNHFEKYHIVRNILFSHYGIDTWYYLHSSNFIKFYKKPQENIQLRYVEISYMHYDNLVSWGESSDDIFIQLPNSILNNRKLGCIWSEHVRMIINKELSSNLKETAHKKFEGGPTKIIALFDTTFGDDVPLQVNDMILFIEGILIILKRHPEIGVIFKGKWSRDELVNKNLKISKKYDELISHERCFFIDGQSGDASEVIAASDLVISACFTSTTIEALGARKKAIFFDSTNRFRGCYYDKFPNLVGHSLDELDDMVKYWLYEVNDEQFSKYLDNFIKGKFDSYADGKAITRFRELLSG